MHHPPSYHDALSGIPVALPVQTLSTSQPSGADLQHWPPRVPSRAWSDWFPVSAALEQWTELSLLHSSAWNCLSYCMFASILWGSHHESLHGWWPHSALSGSIAFLWGNQRTVNRKKYFGQSSYPAMGLKKERKEEEEKTSNKEITISTEENWLLGRFNYGNFIWNGKQMDSIRLMHGMAKFITLML